MTAPYRKKLIEVALPLKAINEASAREKSIRHGHPSTLHLWWARRPLAACRAVLFASLVDDPDSDPQFAGDEDAAATKRAALFSLIEELVQWENSNNPEVIRSARAEIARSVASRKVELGELDRDYELAEGVTVGSLIRDCWVMPKAWNPTAESRSKSKKKDDRVRYSFGTTHLPPEEVVNAFLAEHAPPVLDPFAGGGSIPLEAQRLGLRAYASDLNPVAVLINKALIEIPPKFAGRPPVNPESRKDPKSQVREWRGAEGLAEDIRYYGKWMRDEAEKRIGHLYPKVKITKEFVNDRPDLEQYIGRELTILAWFWARTVKCPDPAYPDGFSPLISTFYLCKKTGKQAWIERIDNHESTGVDFRVVVGEPPDSKKKMVAAGTKSGRGKFSCMLSGQALDPKYVKTEGLEGRIGNLQLACVAQGNRERVYLPGHTLPQAEPSDFLCEIECPLISGYFNPPIYGYLNVGSMFNDRQRKSLETFASLIPDAVEEVVSDGGEEAYAAGIAAMLTLATGRLSNRLTSFCIWDTGRENIAQTFSEQGVPMSWDYVEANPFSGGTGSWDKALEYIPTCIENTPCGFGDARQHNASTPFSHLPEAPVVSTDPPYYSSIAYADFADFFYGTFRAGLRKTNPELFGTMATPKAEEAVAAWHRHNGDRKAAAIDFTTKLGKAFGVIGDMAASYSPVTIYYAFKQQEVGESEDALVTAWESILAVVISGGLAIHSTWPIRTEQISGRKADKNVLASSIVIVCRPALSETSLATRREFIASLKEELPEALQQLRSCNIAPVDLAQAAIGPGMAVFTRYTKVMEADGETMSVRTALALINQSLDEVLAEQEGEFDADTRWALAWFEEHGIEEGPYGTAETLSKAKNTAVAGLVEAGIIKSGSGKVRLLKRDELSEDWNPATDKRLRHWETVQHMIRTLESGGESAAAELMRELGGAAEPARDLAYRLFSLCERKKWAQEAFAYNGLVTAWPEIEKLARAAKNEEVKQQTLI